MAVLANIYSGTFDIASSASLTGNNAIGATVTVANSFVLFGLTSEGTPVGKNSLTLEIDAEGDGLDYETGNTSFHSKTVQWYVVEFTSGLTVTHGRGASTGTLPVILVPDITTADAQSFVIPNGGEGDIPQEERLLAALYLSGNDLIINKGNNSTVSDHAWQVVEYDSSADLVVAHGSEVDSDAATASFTAVSSVTDSVMMVQTFAGGSRGVNDVSFKTFFDSTSAASIDRAAAGANAGGVLHWQAINFKDGTTSAHHTASMADTVATDTVTGVNGDSSADSIWFPISNVSGQSMFQSDEGSETYNAANVTYAWAAADASVLFTREDTSAANSANFSVITWNAAAAAVGGSVLSLLHRNQMRHMLNR